MTSDSGATPQPPETPEPARQSNAGDRTALSLGELLLALVNQGDSLERAWSAALDAVEIAEARAEFAALADSVYHAVLRQTEGLAEKLSQRGLDRLGADFPLPAAAAAALEVHPIGDQRLRQLQVAALYALEDFLRAVKAVTSPEDHRSDIDGAAALHSWWESGAFALVRARAQALSAILSQQAAAYAGMAEELGLEPNDVDTSLVPTDDAVVAYEKAVALVDLGFHDAALPLFLASLRTRLTTAGLLNPSSTLTAALQVQGAHPLRGILRRLEEASRHLGYGNLVPGEAAIPLSKVLVDLVPRIGIRRVVAPSEGEARNSPAPPSDSHINDAGADVDPGGDADPDASAHDAAASP